VVARCTRGAEELAMRSARRFAPVAVFSSLLAAAPALAQPAPAPAPTQPPAAAPAPAAPVPAPPSAAAPSPAAPAQTLAPAPAPAPAQTLAPAPAPAPSAAVPAPAGAASTASAKLPVSTAGVVDVPVVGKLAMRLYGFAELDAIYDSTQSYNEVAGNALVQRPETYKGSHRRLTFGARNSRLGFRVRSEVAPDVKVGGLIEVDFLGNQPSDASEGQTFTNPALRMRQAIVELESPWVNVVAGETWQLFGWQPRFLPTSVQIQGLPGELFGRAPQFRVSHVHKTEPVDFEIAVAAARAPQRDSGTPDGQAGLRATLNKWRGMHTSNATATSIEGLTLGVSGVVRHFAVPELAATPGAQHTATGYGLALNALLPVIPATPEKKGNSLTLTGAFVRGTGISDLFVALTGGVAFPPLPTPKGATTAPTFPSGIDAGMVTYDKAGTLRTIGWQSFLVGAEYYLPPSGRVFVAGNFAQVSSNDVDDLAPKGMKLARFADANVFVDVVSGLRLGVEYAWFHQTYVDGVTAKNHRGQMSAYFIF
jgi:hypothetical protein